MRDELIQLLQLPPSSTDEAIIEAVSQQRARVSGLTGTTFANLDEQHLKFVLTRIEKGWELGRAASVAVKFCALSPADQAAVLKKEIAGLSIEQGLEVLGNQARRDAQP